VAFIASLAFIDVLVNLRYPGREQPLWYLIPSVDVLVLFMFLALLRWNGWRVPKVLRVLLVGAIFLVRLLRLGDGVQDKYFAQNFNLYTDLRMLPQLTDFVRSSLPRWKFALVALLAVGGLIAVLVLCHLALGHVERYLSKRQNILVLAAVSGLSFVALSPLSQDPGWSDHYFGGLAASVVPRIMHEARFLSNVYSQQSERTREIAHTQERLAQTPSNLAKLHGTNVFLILVESYGRVVFDRPFFVSTARPVYQSFESELLDRGFAIASGTLTSPTYGGHSWLAHTTLATGVTVTDELQFELVSASHPKTMARVFHDAGYRTVLVQPGTTREWPKGDFYQFDHKYYAYDFDYAGPPYAWATMPDQYVLDFIRRNELAMHRGPLFVEYVLVSSHAPWSELPTIVDDWKKLGDGAIFQTNERMLYPITWPHFANASQAYIDSIMYDFEVLKRYIAEFVLDDTLILIIGDHQPVAEITGTQFPGVPVHVLSRDGALVEAFVARGFARGMTPPTRSSYPPMSSFIFSFLGAFSTGEAARNN
jgi:hypothetical protein